MRIIFILALVGLLSISGFGQDDNVNWIRDTNSIANCSSTVLSFTDTTFQLSRGEAIRVIAQVNDSSSAGFASDSIQVEWGYQTYSLCYDSSDNPDTCLSPRIIIDTLKNDSLGKMRVGRRYSDGLVLSYGGQLDTLGCAGWAIQSVTFKPEFDVLFRLWTQGLTGNVTSAPLKLRFAVVRRLYSGVRKF